LPQEAVVIGAGTIADQLRPACEAAPESDRGGRRVAGLQPPQAFTLRTLADDSCEILASELGHTAAVRGAAALALREVIADPVSIRMLLAS
jgi:hypothetical protein